MPYSKVSDHPECPTSEPVGVVKDSDGKLMGCHANDDEANAQLAALHAAEEEERMAKSANIVVSLQDGLLDAFAALQDGITRFINHLQPDPTSEERAIGMNQIYYKVDEALYQMDSWPYLLDLYLEDQEMFAIAADGGKLYRFSVNLDGASVALGEAQEVEPMFQPVGGSEDTPRTRTTVFREADGTWRWLSISCTAILNRVGEIDTRALFDSIVEYAEETGEYPFRTFYHCGEALKYGQCDYLAREGYTLISSGIFDTEGPNADLALAEIKARQEEPGIWGESIGYKPTELPEWVEVSDGIQVLAFNKGIGREISCVLESDAAALFTQSTAQEVFRMRDKIKEALAKFGIGTERIDELEEAVDATNRAVLDEGLVARTADDTEDTEGTGGEEITDTGGDDEDTEDAEGDGMLELVVGEEVVEEAASRAAASLLASDGDLMGALSAIAEAVEALREITEAANGVLDQRISQLEQSDDEKREQWLEDLPRSRKVHFTYRPREAHAQDEQGPEGEGDAQDFSAQAEKTISNLGVAY